MRMGSKWVFATVAICGFSGVSFSQDEGGMDGAAGQDPVQEEVAPPAESEEPAVGEEAAPQKDEGANVQVQDTDSTVSNTPVTKGTAGTMADIQEALNRHGATLKVDGKFGNGTKSALKTFQKKNKLKVTGKVDEPTKKALGLAG